MNLKKEEVYRTKQVIDDTDKIYDLSKAFKFISGERVMFPKPHYQLMKTLISLISYENVVYIKRDELCSILNVVEPNLLRKLKMIDHLVEYYSHQDDRSVEQGYVRIEINPVYGWKPSYTTSRADAVKWWYAIRELCEESKQDFVLRPEYREHLQYLM